MNGHDGRLTGGCHRDKQHDVYADNGMLVSGKSLPRRLLRSWTDPLGWPDVRRQERARQVAMAWRYQHTQRIVME